MSESPRPAQDRRKPAAGDAGSAGPPRESAQPSPTPWPDEGLDTPSENRTRIPSPDSGAWPACERRRPNRARAGRCFVVERALCGAPTGRPSGTQVRLATLAGAAFATGQCSRPGGRLRATASVANQESHARPKQKCDGCRQPRVVRFAHRPGNAAVPRRAARRLSAWQRHSDAGAAARTKAVVARQDAHAWLRGDRARAPSSLDRQPSKHGHVRA